MKTRFSILLACTAALLLAGCGGGASDATVTKTLDKIKQGCQIEADYSDIAKAIAAAASGAVPAGVLVVTGADAIAKAVCSQVSASAGVHALVSDPCVATVNGVCIKKVVGK